MTMLVRIVVPLILLAALYVEASSWKKMKKNLSKLSPKGKNEDKTSPGEDDRGEISSKKTRSGLFSIRKKKNKDEAKEKDQGGAFEKRSFGLFTFKKKRHDVTSAGGKEIHDKAPGNIGNKAPSKKNTGSEASTEAQAEEENSEATSKMKVYDGSKGNHHGKVKSKKEPSEFLWKKKHQKAPSDETSHDQTSTEESPSSSSDIPFLYGVSGRETFYIHPKLSTCKLSLHKLGSDESNTCVAAHLAASCEKRADMDVTVYVVDKTKWESKKYDSTIIESDGKMEFDTLTAHGNPHPDLTHSLNAVKKLYELDTSIRNIPYGRDFFYGVNKDSKQSLYVDLFAPFMKGFCDTNGEAIREGEKVLVFPVGRSLLGKITREGSFEYVILEGFVREEVDNHSDPRAYGMGVEGQYTESLRECDDLVEWYRRIA
ncbi:hypothetical protein FOZ60_000222 [Perkinsus olseni]|uniref:Uncharacterized protein n=1 Tax=Perkinsus olseni TaxID=32597 RepID=A0A7J6PK88_PEROL|nr:hypothetical protein FOZ60_000222 [Perkinsus olseni]